MASNPAPDRIKSVRESAKLTQTEAGALVYCTLRAWQSWESGERKMSPALWELFRLKLTLGIHNK